MKCDNSDGGMKLSTLALRKGFTIRNGFRQSLYLISGLTPRASRSYLARAGLDCVTTDHSSITSFSHSCRRHSTCRDTPTAREGVAIWFSQKLQRLHNFCTGWFSNILAFAGIPVIRKPESPYCVVLDHDLEAIPLVMEATTE